MSYDPYPIIKDNVVIEQGEFNHLLGLFKRSINHKLYYSAISEFAELNRLMGAFEVYSMFLLHEDWFKKFLFNANEEINKCREQLLMLLKKLI